MSVKGKKTAHLTSKQTFTIPDVQGDQCNQCSIHPSQKTIFYFLYGLSIGKNSAVQTVCSEKKDIHIFSDPKIKGIQ